MHSDGGGADVSVGCWCWLSDGFLAAFSAGDAEVRRFLDSGSGSVLVSSEGVVVEGPWLSVCNPLQLKYKQLYKESKRTLGRLFPFALAFFTFIWLRRWF